MDSSRSARMYIIVTHNHYYDHVMISTANDYKMSVMHHQLIILVMIRQH